MMNLMVLVALLEANPAGAVPLYAKEQSRADTLVCRNLQEMGSRIRYNRICLTAADWERMEIRVKHEMWKAERNAVMRPGQGMTPPTS